MAELTPLARSVARQLRRDEPASTGDGARVRLADLGVVPRPAQPARRAPRLAPGDGGALRRAMARQVGPLFDAAAGAGAGAPESPVGGAPQAPLAAVAPLAAAVQPASEAAAAAPRVDPEHGYPPFERVPVAGMRRVIAERLAASKREAPHYYMSADCLADALLAMRRDLNATLPQPDRLSVNDLVLALTARCLARHPALNAAWDGDAVARFAHVNLAVAVAVDGGLVTPVLREADALGLLELHRSMQALVDAARRRALPREAFAGGSFTVSNLGMYPVSHFAAIVNPPQAAILAVAAARRCAVALDDERSGVRRVMTLTLSVDHRVADGVAGAEFLADLKSLIEEPRRALL